MDSRIARLVVLLGLLAPLSACDGHQPLDPNIQVAPTAGSGPTVNAPSGTNAVASYNSIDVSWQDNSTKETGFEVHRSTTGSSGTFALLATTGANVTSYGDTGLTAGAQYCYEVRSFSGDRKHTTYSTFSVPACATTPFTPLPPPPPPPPSEPPAAPGPLTASVYPWRIELWWSDNGWDGVTKGDGFRVERCDTAACGDTGFTVIAVHLRGSVEWNFYADYAVEPGSTYTYRVRAFNSAGESLSNEASATACYVGTDWEGGGYYICVDP
jgi:titin